MKSKRKEIPVPYACSSTDRSQQTSFLLWLGFLALVILFKLFVEETGVVSRIGLTKVLSSQRSLGTDTNHLVHEGETMGHHGGGVERTWARWTSCFCFRSKHRSSRDACQPSLVSPPRDRNRLLRLPEGGIQESRPVVRVDSSQDELLVRETVHTAGSLFTCGSSIASLIWSRKWITREAENEKIKFDLSQQKIFKNKWLE